MSKKTAQAVHLEIPEPELVLIADLKPHPRNYREHPDDQVEHIAASIRQHGFYRNIVAARDGTILAGHGVVKAARKLGMDQVRVVRLDLAADDARALKILAGDNEIPKLAEVDDRALTEILKEIRDVDVDELIGTGFDDAMLAALVFNTRPASEIEDKEDAGQWVGLPEYEEGEETRKLIVSFRNDADRSEFVKQFDISIIHTQNKQTWSAWWPARERDDLSSVRFEEG